MSTHPLQIDGQIAHAHDEGHRSGTFHTFDALDLSERFGPRKVHVFLPRGYEAGATRYPVVYLHDGNTAFWRGGEGNKTWDVAGTLDRLEGQIQPLIVVAVHPLDRASEYTHDDWLHGDRPYGRLPEHAAYLALDIKGFVDRNYRTRPEPACNAVVGSSHGGLAAFWTATGFPEAFGAAAAMSPSFWVGLDSLILPVIPGDLEDSALIRHAGPALGDPVRHPKLWIDWGLRRDGGFHNAVIEAKAAQWGGEMARQLVVTYGYLPQSLRGDTAPRTDVDLWVYEDALGGHDEEAWAWRFGLFLRAVFPR